MNKKSVYAFSLILLVATGLVVALTRPSVDNAWFLIFFFVLYYCTVYFVTLSLGYFLQFALKKVRRVALVAASVITAMQILITFNALRPLELFLITAVLVASGWYVAKAKT